MKKMKQIVAISILFSSIASFANTPAKEGATPPLPKADVYVVPQPKDMPLSLSYPAQIYPSQSVNVVARVSGVLQEKFFEEGSFVQKGQKLYKIEDTIYQAKVDAALASLQMAEAVLNNASRVWNRTKELYAKKAVSQESRDNALSGYEQAVASLALAKANLNQAKVDLEYTNVVAPMSGIVGMKQVDIGDYVSAGVGTKLVGISQNDVINIEFSMPLSDYMNIKNQIWTLPQDGKIKVSLIVNDKPIEKNGVIDFVDVNANRDTATLKMRAVIDNSDRYLVPGSFVRVHTEDIYQKSVITIPQKAVLQNPLGTVVFVEKDGIVSVKPVQVSNESKDMFILKQGAVQSGDRIILNNFFRIKPGSKITVDKIVNE